MASNGSVSDPATTLKVPDTNRSVATLVFELNDVLLSVHAAQSSKNDEAGGKDGREEHGRRRDFVNSRCCWRVLLWHAELLYFSVQARQEVNCVNRHFRVMRKSEDEGRVQTPCHKSPTTVGRSTRATVK